MSAPREPRDLAAAAATCERVARRFRVSQAAAFGIRLVPANPSALEFPPIPYACDVRPAWCGECRAPCQYGEVRR